MALDILLQVSITFWFYYIIIHWCNKTISKFTPIYLTGSFLPGRCCHLWILHFWCFWWCCCVIKLYCCHSLHPPLHSYKKWIIGSLQQIEVKVCFYVLALSFNELGKFHLGHGYRAIYGPQAAMLKMFSVLCLGIDKLWD